MSDALDSTLEPLRVRVDYDFASSLCYVAHRRMDRLRRPLEELGIALEWSPLDLSRITGWRRGAEMDETRRANVLRVSRELAVPLRIPRTWQDSRRAHAIALVAPQERRVTWRERVFTAVYEEGRTYFFSADQSVARRHMFEAGASTENEVEVLSIDGVPLDSSNSAAASDAETLNIIMVGQDRLRDGDPVTVAAESS